MNKTSLKILGVRIDRVNYWNKILSYLDQNKLAFISTPNPEIILKAQKDPQYLKILNSTSLNIPDGTGLVLAALIHGKIIRRFTGADLLPKLLSKAERMTCRVLILNWHKGLSSKHDIEKVLKNLWPELELLVIDIEREEKLSRTIGSDITDYAPDIVINNLGAPWQEKIIYSNVELFSKVRLAIGLGGAIDFITNKRKRAPKIFINLGLEWLYRLFEQKKINRIIQAVIVFPWLLIKNYGRKY